MCDGAEQLQVNTLFASFTLHLGKIIVDYVRKHKPFCEMIQRPSTLCSIMSMSHVNKYFFVFMFELLQLDLFLPAIGLADMSTNWSFVNPLCLTLKRLSQGNMVSLLWTLVCSCMVKRNCYILRMALFKSIWKDLFIWGPCISKLRSLQPRMCY